MPRKLLLTAPRQIELVTYDDPPLQPGQVRARGLLSGISHGTELNLYRGTSPFTDKRFDPDLRLFVPAETTATYPQALGYEWVGEVEEVGAGVTHLRPGDRVHLLAPHAETHTFDPFHVPYRGVLQPLPPALPPEEPFSWPWPVWPCRPSTMLASSSATGWPSSGWVSSDCSPCSWHG